ncbi:hypothetical protein J1N35_013744 [Gossypium stocksii]|uniref:Uncharacterized protein n=1 Tax=Gossypium stocksii TaxID=47602 RepID=A0A9D3VU99_9ROSI|nr:hypothetical protein J1N35_013744 [Gossypium stocksii]
MDVVRRHRYHILHPVESIGQLIDVRHQGAVGSVGDGGNARIEPGNAAVQVEEGMWLHNSIIIDPDRRSVACVYAIYRYIFPCTDVFGILHPQVDVDTDPNVGSDARLCTTIDDDTDTDAHVAIDVDVDAHAVVDANVVPMQQSVPMSIPKAIPMYQDLDTLLLLTYSHPNTAHIIILLRMTQQSTTDDDDDAIEPKDQGHRALVGGSPNDDGIKEEVYRPTALDVHLVAPSAVHKNPLRDYRPPPCSIHSLR